MKKLRICLLIVAAVLVCMLSAFPQGAVGAEGKKVYVGGFPIGISIDVGGLLVESVTGVETEYGTAYTEGLGKGDIIKKINGTPVSAVDDIKTYLTEDVASLEIVRGGVTVNVEVKPIIEAFSLKPRLGVKVKDKIYGIGTVSFVGENGSFAALGHEIYDADTATHIPFTSGKIHGCKILGVKKGGRGEAGALLGSLVADSDYGVISCNNKFGIAGKYTGDLSGQELMTVADRSDVKPGSAKIRTTVDGSPEYYDIEIIKASSKHGRHEKSIVFRVTDKRLLDKTGGVVRGMSGSPIVQNGKLVGAVTHVFLNDFTKGYGIYADCLN